MSNNVDVVLTENYPQLGYVGDKVKVRGGFARNYLIPRGLAIAASDRALRELTHKMTAVQAKRVKLRGEAENVAKQLNTLSMQFTMKIGDGGRSFGSITAREIEEELRKSGFAVDKRQVIIADPIRKVGEYIVKVKLHSEVVSEVRVKVAAEVQAKVEGADADTKASRPRRKRSDDVATEEVTEETPAE